MTIANNIKYYTREEIDTLKWNRCIEEADNGLIYAHSFYLDIMAGKWDALILNDYEAVMPLPWNRKYGFYYLYQPYFTRTLGVFGTMTGSVTVFDFLCAIPKKFRYWNIDLNETNLLDVENSFHLKITQRANYHLNLDKLYEKIFSGYKKSCQQRIRKASRHQVRIFTDGSPADAINFYRDHYESRHSKISPDVYKRLIAVVNLCFEKDQAKIYLAKLPSGEITAVKLILYDEHFVYSLLGGSSETGKQTASYYLLTDATIRDHANCGRTFRFEGSQIPGVAAFNIQFGAEFHSYLHLNKNSLPFPVNLIKKI